MTSSQEDDEYHLIGLAIVAAQRVEFVLYGIAAHARHTSAAQKEKRFRNLTPEEFFRGDQCLSQPRGKLSCYQDREVTFLSRTGSLHLSSNPYHASLTQGPTKPIETERPLERKNRPD